MIKQYPLLTHLKEATPLFEEIKAYWFKKGGDESIHATIQNYQNDILAERMKGLVLMREGKAVAMAWFEIMGLHYGNVMFYSSERKDQKPLVEHVISAGFFDEYLLHELVMFEDETDYEALLLEAGLKVCVRDRMAVFIDEWPGVEIDESKMRFEKYNNDYIPECAHMSYLAHQVSQDQALAVDMSTHKGRLELEYAITDGLFGTFNRECSYVMFFEGQMAAMCTIVDIAAWGYEKVPWIFDLVVHPNFHGRRLGKIMMLKIINELAKTGTYTLMGLAVTQDNSIAKGLYERLGFQVTQTFKEYAFPFQGA